MELYKRWLCHIAADLINNCLSLNLENCPGCRDGLTSPILHVHTSFSLKDVIEKYFDGGVERTDIDTLYKFFSNKMELPDDPKYDELITLGKSFLRTLNPRALFYGNYITAENDKLVEELLTVPSILELAECSSTSPTHDIDSDLTPKKRKIVRKQKDSVKESSSHENIRDDEILPLETYDPSSPSYEPTPIKRKTPMKKKVNIKDTMHQRDIRQSLDIQH